MNEREAYIALNMIEGIGPVTVRSLVAVFGSVRSIFEADKVGLRKVRGVGPVAAERLRSCDIADRVAGEIADTTKLGGRIVTPVDVEYPSSLATIHNPPLALYVRGDVTQLATRSIAVVGTRRATHYGRECAERLAFQLCQVGFVVTSGLAQGIDTCAHSGALKAGGKTTGVLGSGVDRIFPPENKGLARRMTSEGAVISEFPLGTRPDKTTFPIRNRIVSGLSRGVVVVESTGRGGAMITASLAAEQGRSVFAVPGRIDSALSRGPHHLIRDGARLVESADDIIEEFEFLIPGLQKEGAGQGQESRLTEEELRLTEILSEGPAQVDRLIRESGMPAAAVSSLLIGLEMKRVTRMLSGRMVELRSPAFAKATAGKQRSE